MKKLLALLTFIFSITTFLNAQPPPPPPDCTNYAEVDFFPFYGDEVCDGYGAFVELFVITNGPPQGEFYDIIVTGTDGSQGFGFADDYGFGFADLFPNPVEGCEPEEVSFEMTITCPYTGEVLDVVDLGTFTIYPQLFVDVIDPGCGEGENGSATLVALNGEICDGPIEGTAGVEGDCETQEPGTLSYDFNPFPESLYCFFNFADEIEVPCTELEFGCTNPDACNFSETAVCDDGSCIEAEVCCPMPVGETLPTAICAGGYYDGEEVCITFDGDISAIDFYSMFIFGVNGGFGFPVSSDPATNEICFIIDAYGYYYYDFCLPYENNFTLEYECFDTGQFVSFDLGIITVYPPPFIYDVFSAPSPECGGTPEIFPPYCGELILGEVVPPNNDCDNLASGSISYTIDPGFDITGAPDCFTAILTGEVPIPPCTEDCPCEGEFCEGVCIDIMATASDLPEEVCPDEPFQYQLDITGLGADFGNYFILTFDNTGANIGFDVHNPGDPTTFFPDIFPFVQGCEPVDQTFTYEIICPADGAILASGTIGTVLVYPSPFNFFPNITPSEACVQDLMITPGPCGTVVLNPDPIPVPGCGGEDSEVTWSVDFGFEYPPDCIPFPIEGTEPVFACDGEPGDPCDDGNPCTTNDMLDENCTCVSEGPTAMLDSDLPAAVCSEDVFTLTVTVDLIPGSGLFVVINDNFNGYPGVVFLAPGDPLTIDVDIFPFNQQPCDPQELELFLQLFCPYTYDMIGATIPLGTVNVFPNSDPFVPEIEPSQECGVAPVIIAPECGELTVTETPAAPPACPAGEDGFVEYTIDPGFDIGAAPDCFDVSLLSGQATITACSECCPFVVDVTLEAPGPFCSGDMTEVCVTFDPAFDSDGQLTVNGIDAVAGEDQICFDLTLVNDGCNYEPVQVPFEIICNEDGSVIDGFTPDVLVAPDPANFQYEVLDPGGCGFAPFVGPANNSPCFVFTGYPPLIITEPVDGCPPMDGEVEFTLDYFNDDFFPLDIAAFGCDGFETTILLPQPGCSNCVCPNPPANITLTENTCEGGMLELCIEFEAGDEANAIGTTINIGGDAGTFVNLIISGDGMSTTYCTEFVPGALIECEPITENYEIDLFCASDGTPLFSDAASSTIYPALDKFAFAITPGADNCPDSATLPLIANTGDCDLAIVSAETTPPVDGCPPTAGELTYSVDYADPALFANAPAECLFTPIVDAVEPIPACETCMPDDCVITPDMAINILCDDNGTPGDASDDTYTFDITVNGSNGTAGASNTFNDDQGNSGIAYGSAVSYGPFPITGGNITVTFTDVDDAACTATMMAAAPPSCSADDPCEDEISGTVIPPAGCSVAGITVTIYDSAGNVVTTLTTDANGVYDSSPMAYPCGDYTAQLTANIPSCYNDASGETGPKPFTIDDDPTNDDTDGADFAPEPVDCNFMVGVSSFDCINNGTIENPGDDSANITFMVMNSGSNWTSDVAIGGVTSGGDGMMLTETGVPAGTNIVVVFTSDDDPNCTFTLNYTVPDCTVQIPTLSQWGLMVLALLLMSFGAIKMSNSTTMISRKKVANGRG